ncbi:MAG: hypothetical protein CR978_01745 [Gammaproteobacteria bacterium]|nr:MAG: hypothetical protein CR978_01745 [Gammaproteobacteria bacterium]
MADFDDTEHWEEDLGPSKSELKRQMIALQKLGERLVTLPEKKLARIPIGDERLAKAIFEARRIRSKNALKRQHQFIGKLMRNIDPAAIEQALAELDQQHQHQVDAFHAIEQLRDQALAQGVAGVELILQTYPHADRQQLRQLLLQHAREQRQQKPPTAARKLFQYLKALATD